MSAYIIGEGGATLEHNRQFLLLVSLGYLIVAVALNIIGLNIGKWLQNAGGISTYAPLLLLVALGGFLWLRQGAVTHLTWANVLPVWNWDTVNFWSQIAFAFTGLELVSAMSQEIRDPQRTLPRAVFAAGVLIAALLATVGNAGGVGSTVAGIARVPFVVGIDRYLPAAFGKIHPRWRTPYVSIIVQAVVSGLILFLSQINSPSVKAAYQFLIDAAIILYFIPFLYMFAAAIKLVGRRERLENKNAVLIPCGKSGVWIVSILGFATVLIGIIVSLVPPGDSSDKLGFELRLVGGTLAAIALGLSLYWRGAREKSRGMIAAGD